MKRFLPLAVVALFAGSAFAQISLTAAVHGPVIGDSFNILRADTTGVQPGPAGASQTWNFSSLVIDTVPASITYDDLANQTFAADFPNGNMVLADGSGGFTILESNANALTLHGINNSTLGSIPYTDAQILMNFPVSFGAANVNNDAFAASYTLLGFPVTRSGTSSTVADAYGTLILPGGTFNNVLRVKTTSSINDATPLGATTTDQVDYKWYDANNKNYLLTISVTTTVAPILGTTVTKVVAVLDNPTASGLSERRNDIGNISVFPNPASDHFLLNIDLKKSGKYTLSVFSADGRIMMNDSDVNMLAGRQNRSLDISAFPEGIYLLCVAGEDASQTIRFIKQ
jgi:hypothetical protein